MSIIKSHDITLRGDGITLKPLCDEHLPLLYKWNKDSEMLYWCEEDECEPHDEASVNGIWGSVSKSGAFCFLIEADDTPIGECWLQKMNYNPALAMYDDGLDVRRIDMAIGEKAYWGKGFGTQAINLLKEFAFGKESVDILHCMPNDYNERSWKMLEKCGFKRVLEEEIDLPKAKGKLRYHYRLTREEYELKSTEI